MAYFLCRIIFNIQQNSIVAFFVGRHKKKQKHNTQESGKYIHEIHICLGSELL